MHYINLFLLTYLLTYLHGNANESEHIKFQAACMNVSDLVIFFIINPVRHRTQAWNVFGMTNFDHPGYSQETMSESVRLSSQTPDQEDIFNRHFMYFEEKNDKKWWHDCQTSTTVDTARLQRKRSSQQHPEKRSGERDVGSRLSIVYRMLEEDGGGSSRQNWMETIGLWLVLHWDKLNQYVEVITLLAAAYVATESVLQSCFCLESIPLTPLNESLQDFVTWCLSVGSRTTLRRDFLDVGPQKIWGPKTTYYYISSL